MFKELISLAYPRTCINCNDTLLEKEAFICLSCKSKLPCTEDHLHQENHLFQKFAYEPKIQIAAAYLYFIQGGSAQKLLYQLKYKGKKEIGHVLGSWFGEDLQKVMLPDLIVPIPIHASKQLRRGYNQSEQIALGLQEVFKEAELATDLVTREVKTETQTRKSKVERWENVSNVYSQCTQDLTGKSVLVVDDVITTGATVGMLCSRLVEANVEAIYIASLARGQ